MGQFTSDVGSVAFSPGGKYTLRFERQGATIGGFLDVRPDLDAAVLVAGRSAELDAVAASCQDVVGCDTLDVQAVARSFTTVQRVGRTLLVPPATPLKQLNPFVILQGGDIEYRLEGVRFDGAATPREQEEARTAERRAEDVLTAEEPPFTTGDVGEGARDVLDTLLRLAPWIIGLLLLAQVLRAADVLGLGE